MNRSAWAIGKEGSTTYKLNEMYKAKTGRDLDDTSARNMQSFFALADAINRAGSTDPEKIRVALTQIPEFATGTAASGCSAHAGRLSL